MFRRKFNFSLKISQEEARWNVGVSPVVTEGMDQSETSYFTVFDNFQQLVVKLISRLREGSLHFLVVLIYQAPSVSPLLHCRTS